MHTSSSDSRLLRDWDGDEDDEYYMKRMSEILDEPPNIGPPAHPGKMLDHVYIGNLDNAEDYDLLPAIGITHVLNVAGTRNFDLTRSRYPAKLGITDFFMIPAEDYEEYNIAEHFPDAIAFLDRARASGGKAMVHCNLGVNRSGAVVAAYMMVNQRKTLLKVLSELKIKRSVVLCNTGFRSQLLKYARCRGLLDPVEKSPSKLEISRSQSYHKINENEFSTANTNGQDSGESKEIHFGTTNEHSHAADASEYIKFGSSTENIYGGSDTLSVPLTIRSPVRSSGGTYVPSPSASYLLEENGSSDDDDTMRSIRLARVSLTSSTNYHTSTLLPPTQSSYTNYVSGSSGSTYVSPVPDRFTSSLTLPERYTGSDVSSLTSSLSNGLSSTSSLGSSSTSVHPLLIRPPPSYSYAPDNFKTTVKPRSYYHRKVLGRAPRFVDFEEESGDSEGFKLDLLSELFQSRQRDFDVVGSGADYGSDWSYGSTARRSSFPGHSVLDEFSYQPTPYVNHMLGLPTFLRTGC